MSAATLAHTVPADRDRLSNQLQCGGSSVPPGGNIHRRALRLVAGVRRRCLHLFIDFPGIEQERKIVELKVPGIDERLAAEAARFAAAIRKLGLLSVPSSKEAMMRLVITSCAKFRGWVLEKTSMPPSVRNMRAKTMPTMPPLTGRRYSWRK